MTGLFTIDTKIIIATPGFFTYFTHFLIKEKGKPFICPYQFYSIPYGVHQKRHSPMIFLNNFQGGARFIHSACNVRMSKAELWDILYLLWKKVLIFSGNFSKQYKIDTFNNRTLSPFVPNAPFPYPLKRSENLTVLWCFKEVEKGCTGNKWIKWQRQLFRRNAVFLDHSFSMRAKCFRLSIFSEKLTFLSPWYTLVRVRIRGSKIIVSRKILRTYEMDDLLKTIRKFPG